jgi:hypothetical protein
VKPSPEIPFCVPEASAAKGSFGGAELFLWFAEMMCSAGHKIGEIGGAVAHHLLMMCRTDGENGFRARVSASNAIHPAMMCSGGGEKPQTHGLIAHHPWMVCMACDGKRQRKG